MSTDDRVPPVNIGDDIEAWTKARLGKVTASRVYDVTFRTKKGLLGAAYHKYMFELLAERLTGMREDVYLSQEMMWGAQSEYEAGLAYEKLTDKKITRGWVFVDHPKIAMTGASPDAFVGDDGLIEIKCLKTSNHLKYLITKEIPEEYAAQMQWQMACSGRAWVDYAPYESRLPAALRLRPTRVMRDEKVIEQMTTDVKAFLAEMDKAMVALAA
jgi:exodeoxyribonuclease (lambda-induced)